MRLPNGRCFGPNDPTNIYTPTNVEENPFDSGFLVRTFRNDKPEWNNSGCLTTIHRDLNLMYRVNTQART